MNYEKKEQEALWLRHNSVFKIPHSERGFTLLYAALIGSLLFSMGIAIAHVAIKEITLAASGKQSAVAFYAADAGLECALYFDRQMAGTFPTWSGAPRPRSSITCDGDSVSLDFGGGGTPIAATTTFAAPFSVGCAEVAVGKTLAGGTVIESRGRNECGSASNPARVERALRARY